MTMNDDALVTDFVERMLAADLLHSDREYTHAAGRWARLVVRLKGPEEGLDFVAEVFDQFVQSCQ
jgi:hypothetical protein